MPNPRKGLALHLLAFILAAATLAAAAPLTVMSFNIRYGTANDGDNRWELRRELLFDVVREEGADIIGLQEALHFQIQEIVEAVPAYASVGVGRDDGKEKGEHSAILFRKERLRVLDSGTFWFSDTPEVPGSTSWGNRITRICTWTRFADERGGSFYVYNVHLDHESQPSRERSVQLLAQRIRERAVPADPVVVTGDFNVGEDNGAIRWLLGEEAALAGAGTPGVELTDTLRAVHPDARSVGTFTNFRFGNIHGQKIDYVLTGPGFEAASARLVRTSRDGKYPSDHFPVVARLVRHQGS